MILFQWIFRIVVVTFWLSKANMKTATSSTPTKTSIQACTNGSLALQCKGFTNVNKSIEIRWKIQFSDSNEEWIDCLMSDDECFKVPRLPDGIKVDSVSRQNVTIERSQENSTINQVKILCAVDHQTRTGTCTTLSDSYEINFTIKCVKTAEGRNLDLTRILQNMVLCERVSYVHWSINGSDLAYCSSCQSCENCFKKGLDCSNDEVSLDFRRRLRFTGGLILTNIQGYDDGREIEVRFDIKKDSGVKRMVGPKTIRILVERARHFSSSVVTNAPILVISTSPRSVSQSRVSCTPFTIVKSEHREHKPTSGASATNRMTTETGTIRSFVEKAWHFSSSVGATTPSLGVFTSLRSVSRSTVSSTPSTIINLRHVDHELTDGALATNRMTTDAKTIRRFVEKARHFSSSVVANTPTSVLSTSPKSVSRRRASNTHLIVNSRHEEQQQTDSASTIERLVVTFMVITVTYLLCIYLR